MGRHKQESDQISPEKEVQYLVGAVLLLMVLGLGVAMILQMGAPIFDKDDLSQIGEQRIGESLSIGRCRDAAQTRADYDRCDGETK